RHRNLHSFPTRRSSDLEIVETNRNYDKEVENQALIAKKMYLVEGAKALIQDDQHTHDKLEKVFLKTKKELSEENAAFLHGWHHRSEEHTSELQSRENLV